MSGRILEQGDDLCLHRAPLIVPVDTPAIEDGAVLVCGNKIVTIGSFQHLRKESAKIVDHEGAVLVPGLINCHTHLELSFLQELGQDNSFFTPGDMTAWIYALVHKRSELAGNHEKNIELGRLALKSMYETGIVAAADIGNLGESATLSDLSPVQVLFFMETFGLSAAEIPEVEKRLAEFDNLSWTGHALYSTHPELIQRLKKRAKMRGDLFPIHTAESEDEVELLKSGEGPFAEFLEKRLSETEPQNKTSIHDIFSAPGKGAIAHLADLGCLDHKTLCVHCVHVDDHEIDLLARFGASVCLCPGSNQYLGVGEAPVTRIVKRGIKTCLGTDSLASNSRLSLWKEMKLVADQNPDLKAETIFKMATINGAEILGVEKSYGSLSPGKKANMLAVHGLDTKSGSIYERLVHAGSNLQMNII